MYKNIAFLFFYIMINTSFAYVKLFASTSISDTETTMYG